MRIRDTTWKYYGMTKRERRIVDDFCTAPSNYNKHIINGAIKSVNPIIEKEIYNSLVHKQSYAKQNARNYIPIGEKDFYGYRRKVIHEIYKKITSMDPIEHNKPL